MKQKGFVQVIVATACVLATCMPCESVFAIEQTGTGVTDVTVRQVVPKDKPGNTNENGDTPTFEDKGDVRDVADDNTWIVTPITGDTSKKPVRASVQPIAKTGDDSLVGIAAVCGGIGAVLGTMAFMMQKNEDKGTRNEED